MGGNWLSDLALGERYQTEAMRLLGDGVFEDSPKGVVFSDWDFKYNGVPYEVKADRLAHRTGNLCIEYQHSLKPSGIAVTKAEWWFYFVLRGDSYTCYKIPTSVIKERMVGCRKWHTDGGNCLFYLVPASQFSDYIFSPTALTRPVPRPLPPTVPV